MVKYTDIQIKKVASLTDAWIETVRTRKFIKRGWQVASLTDAWIETTFISPNNLTSISSHPSRMRGLKLVLRKDAD